VPDGVPDASPYNPPSVVFVPLGWGRSASLWVSHIAYFIKFQSTTRL